MGFVFAEKRNLGAVEDNIAILPEANPPNYVPHQTQPVSYLLIAMCSELLYLLLYKVTVGYGYGSVQPPQHPVDPDLNTVYLSIFAMLFCCWPCGLIGLIYGIRVSQLAFVTVRLTDVDMCTLLQGMQEHYRGQYMQSARTTQSAKKWAICSIVTGVVIVSVCIFITIVGNAIGLGIAFSAASRNDPSTFPTIATID